MCLLSFAVAPDITARRAFSAAAPKRELAAFCRNGWFKLDPHPFEATNRPRKPRTPVEQPGVIPLGYCHFDHSSTGWYSSASVLAV